MHRAILGSSLTLGDIVEWRRILSTSPVGQAFALFHGVLQSLHWFVFVASEDVVVAAVCEQVTAGGLDGASETRQPLGRLALRLSTSGNAMV